MSAKIDLLDAVMRFNPFWGGVDLLLIFHFFFSWYKSAKKTGWKIDFWYFTLFTGVVQTTLLMYPFSASPLNTVSTIGQIERIAPFVDKVFLISIVGYCSIWLGRYCFEWTKAGPAFVSLAHLILPFSRAIEANVKSRRAMTFAALAAIVLGFFILALQFSHGYHFNGREFFLQKPWLRPLFNVVISVFPVVISFSALRFLQFKEKSAFYLFCSLLLISLFFGARFVFINGLLFLFVQRAFCRNGGVSLWKTGMFCLFLFFVAVLLGNSRIGIYDPLLAISSLFFSFFYGNNFSDLRDFAWILSSWDEEFLYGKSFIAALLSFIPRVFCGLREEWSFSLYTNGLLGFDSDVMPGLRPGFFGESWFNFGLPGVIFFGGAFGFALRFADCQLKEAVRASKDLIQGYSHVVLCYFVQCLAISASMWMFYLFFLMNLALIPCAGIRRQSAEKKLLDFPRDWL
jgi:hypothetical protein